MEETAPQRGRIAHGWRFTALLVAFLFDRTIAHVREYFILIIREKELFLGTLFALLGLLNFESARYCDGNIADYLSCTRPATYYYFDALDITFIVLGVFFILIYWLKRRA